MLDRPGSSNHVVRASSMILGFILVLSCLVQVEPLKEFTEKNAIKLINKHRAVHLGSKNQDLMMKKDFTLTQKAQKIVDKAKTNKGFEKTGYAGVNTYQVCATFGAQVTSKQVIDAW